MRAFLMSVVLIVPALACGSDASYECLSRYEIRQVAGDSTWATEIDDGSGVLEQRVLESELVVLGQVLDVDSKVVPIDSVRSRLLHPSIYEGFEYTLLIEVDLRVREYLKGEGPSRDNGCR